MLFLPNLMEYFNYREQVFNWLFLILLITTAYFSIGFFHGDEHFQLLEFANYLSGNTPANHLAWEFNAQIRPSFQVWIAHFAIKGGELLDANPFQVTFFLRLLTATLTFFVFRSWYQLTRDNVRKSMHGWYQGFLYFTWFIPFIFVRFSSETWSALFIMWGIILTLKSEKKQALFYAGLCFGVSFICRFQSAILIGGFLLWLMIFGKATISQLLKIILPTIAILLFGIILDSQFYGEFVITAYQYFDVNLIQGKAATFGTTPWHFYITDILNRTQVFYGVLMLIGLLYFTILHWKSYISWVVVPFILIHLLIGHKESRFLFPIVAFIPIMLMVFADEMIFQKSDLKWLLKLGIIVFWGFNFPTLIGAVLYSSKPIIEVMEKLEYVSSKRPINLYYIESNPYNQNCLPLDFYAKRSNIQLIKVTSPREVPKNDMNAILFCERKAKNSTYEVDSYWTAIYQDLPVWLTKINFNHWVDRTTISTLYVINSSEVPSQ